MFKLDNFLLTISFTCVDTPNLLDKTIFLGFGFALVSTVSSLASIALASSTSTVNSSPKTRLEASIALPGKNLFI